MNCQAALGHAIALNGDRQEAAEILSHVVLNESRALIHLGLTDRQQALACLEKAWRRRSEEIEVIRHDSRFDPLRTSRDSSAFSRCSSRLIGSSTYRKWFWLKFGAAAKADTARGAL